MSGKSWGIIRYAAGSGAGPEDDCAAFDGWYSDRDDAANVYRWWCERHPHWIVALVSADDIRFSQMTWRPVVGPLPYGTLCPIKRKEAKERGERE